MFYKEILLEIKIIEAEKDVPKNVLIDPGRINQVLRNLIEIAIKYTESEGKGKGSIFFFSIPR